MKRQRSHLPATVHALEAMGSQVAIARRELGWTAAELAERLGVTAQLVARLERGAPGTAVGTVFEAAVVCGVPLFGVDAADLGGISRREADRLALLPSRVRVSRARTVSVDDDF